MARERDIEEVEKEKGYNIKRYFVLFVITTMGFVAIGLLFNVPSVEDPLTIFIIKWFAWFIILLLLMHVDLISDFIIRVETFTSVEDYKTWWGTKLKLVRRSESTSGVTLFIVVIFTAWVFFMPETFGGDIKIVTLLKNAVIAGIITVFITELLTIDNIYIYKTAARQHQN